MAKDKLTAFDIDDNQTIDQNISAFTSALKTIDDALASVLSTSLSKISLEIPSDQDELLDALYAATAPVEPGQPSSSEGAAF
ncbi:hypothetical protein IVB16_33140 [Bradyrhizobium sp. 183]|uniref:hypothetical protein n=1 Tax=unclassified Bradyrhizobium TaxID=2631580 RepID=UPI001FFA6DDE|nr:MULTISPECIES: hypothetical protein [unclassified Bradyrhizobium]MCK1568204.1 hypothetical protein [Bradyrhizobium sp. 173]UPJ79480.1 hypothetical protein IVB17_33135 [Bradyrhizobium sp. 184]UPJ87276.1 hypothetical protein IVB16_33140 [Bradyrhizobium sp. 183]